MILVLLFMIEIFFPVKHLVNRLCHLNDCSQKCNKKNMTHILDATLQTVLVLSPGPRKFSDKQWWDPTVRVCRVNNRIRGAQGIRGWDEKSPLVAL
jgi:hypothetical protein